MANTSYSDYNKIASDFFKAESIFNTSAKHLERKLINDLNTKEYNRRPVGAPLSAGQQVINGNISWVTKSFLETELVLHIERLKEYAKAYYIYHEHEPAVERAIAVDACNVAAVAQTLGMEKDAEDILLFSHSFVIQRFVDAYRKFQSHQGIETLTAILVVLGEMQLLGVEATSEVKKVFIELNNMDLSQYGVNFQFSN